MRSESRHVHPHRPPTGSSVRLHARLPSGVESPRVQFGRCGHVRARWNLAASFGDARVVNWGSVDSDSVIVAAESQGQPSCASDIRRSSSRGVVVRGRIVRERIADICAASATSSLKLPLMDRSGVWEARLVSTLRPAGISRLFRQIFDRRRAGGSALGVPRFELVEIGMQTKRHSTKTNRPLRDI